SSSRRGGPCVRPCSRAVMLTSTSSAAWSTFLTGPWPKSSRARPPPALPCPRRQNAGMPVDFQPFNINKRILYDTSRSDRTKTEAHHQAAHAEGRPNHRTDTLDAPHHIGGRRSRGLSFGLVRRSRQALLSGRTRRR